MSLLTRRPDVLLTPSSDVFSSRGHDKSDYDKANHDEAIVVRIYERIATRLGPRIRHLSVSIHGGQIQLKGECSTYHTKQLAQHAALGVMEHESLENEIVVMSSS